MKEYCRAEDDGRIAYLRLLYCNLGPGYRAWWYAGIVFWTALLFTTMSVCAGDFFAVNLSSIARFLHMSDTLAGCTLLALGNGGPDIFSTWAAVSSSSLQLAIGEIVGATCFIITVVAGSIMCKVGFEVRKDSLLRDAFFLFVTVALLLGTLLQRKFQLWQGLLMIVIYIVYIACVMGYHRRISHRPDFGETVASSQSDQESARTPTEARPLLQSSEPHQQYDGDTNRRLAMPATTYREIEEWRHAHGRCITGPADYIVQPSLPGAVEYLAWKRKQKSQQANGHLRPQLVDAADSAPLPRLHQSDNRILHTFFPSMRNLSQKKIWEIAIGILTLFPFCLVKLIVPVVDNEHAPECEHGWDRWLLLLQIHVAPQFVWILVSLGDGRELTAGSWLMPAVYCLLASILSATLVCVFTNPRKQPRLAPLLSFMGFALSAFLLSTIADEIVSIMKAVSVLIGTSEAFLGFTVFAVGNCIDDFVANLTVTKHGHPIMALAACFGGPLLNVLLGLGVSITYICAKKSYAVGGVASVAITIDPALIGLAATILGTLAFMMLFLRYNNWTTTKKLGVGLIAIWIVAIIVIVALEEVE